LYKTPSTATPMPPITAIFITYNSENEIGGALTAMRQSHDAGLLECLVVDNASRDGTVALVQRDHPWVTIIASPDNLGFGRGLNLGVQRVKTPYVLFVNPDAVLSQDAVHHLLEFMEMHPRAGIVAPAIIKGPESFQHAGGVPSPMDIVARAAGFLADRRRQRIITPGSEPFKTDWLSGAILMVRRELFEALGGFDSRFFLYYEETDLCRRVEEHGYELWAVGKAVAEHDQGASARSTGAKLHSGCISEHFFRSRFYYFTKHHGLPAAIFAEAGEIMALTFSSFLRLFLGRAPRQLLARLQSPMFQFPSPVDSKKDAGCNLLHQLSRSRQKQEDRCNELHPT
jgi:N-acetylglucosaminyl-diphospho-decaprenol L-rhamnosyltransferase